MKSVYCEWLTSLQEIANKDNIIVEARHHDCLEFLFNEDKNPTEAYPEYVAFRRRWYAINELPLPSPAVSDNSEITPKQESASPAVGGMRWRSGKENPKQEGDYFVRDCKKAKEIAYYEPDNGWTVGSIAINTKDFEWLEETASPAVKDDWKERLVKRREQDFNTASTSTSKVEREFLMNDVEAIDRVLKIFR